MKKRKNRGYVRETKSDFLRDYKLFAIACEGGKREPQYFKLFEYLSPRVKVDIIEDKVKDEELFHRYETKSAPKWVLDRAVAYIEQEGLIDEDDLWFVMDTDRWNKEQIREIYEYSKRFPNWHIVLSNPCFEIWLYLHKKDSFVHSSSKSCSEFKSEISGWDREGYSPVNYLRFLRNACVNAEKLDSDKNHYFPKEKETKVYKLVEELLKVIGIVKYEDFVNEKLVHLNEVVKFKKHIH